MSNESVTSVAIIGAGPYGLSIGAHLRSAGADFRIFGTPMRRWRCQMPVGMFLKSGWQASSLSDPARRHTLVQYCSATGIPHNNTDNPVPLDVFTQYALDFQRDLVPGVEDVMVNRIERENGRFELQLANGETFLAREVVIATGLDHTAYIPPELDLPTELLSHSSAHRDLSRFRGKDVTVIGRGQSALETAALLAEQGADVRLLVRTPTLKWQSPVQERSRSLYARLPRPRSGLGSGTQLWFYQNAPVLFSRLPQSIRFERAKNVLGPSGAWWLKERVVGRVPILLEHSVDKAETRGGRAVLHVRRSCGDAVRLTTDHVIAATGYCFVLDRLPFLSATLKSLLRTEARGPVLSTYFESSVPGLYFTGLASAKCFGPAMRFVAGAEFTARRLSRRLAAGRN